MEDSTRGGAGCACRVCDPRRLGPPHKRAGAAWLRGAALYVTDARRAEQDTAECIVRGDPNAAAWWASLAARRWAFAVSYMLRGLGCGSE